MVIKTEGEFKFFGVTFKQMIMNQNLTLTLQISIEMLLSNVMY